MAGETLKTAAELLAAWPDNTSQLINPVDGRDIIISVTDGIAFIEDDPAQTPYVIPMADGVPVDFMSTLVNPTFVANFYALDGNNAIIPDYVNQGITVNPGTFRLHGGSVILSVQKVGGGSGDYVFEGTEGGVLTGNPQTRTLTSTPSILVFSGNRLYDVAAAAPISFDITPSGTSDDIQINDVRISLQGTLI